MSTPASRYDTAQGYVRMFIDTRAMYMRTKAQAEELGAPHLRVIAMSSVIELLRDMVNLATSYRGAIEISKDDMRQTDRDLAGLRQRFRGLYSRWNPDELDDPATWDADTWTDFEETLEGPILTWDRRTCEAQWGIPFLPPCEGPDLLTAVRTINQLIELRTFQAVTPFIELANLYEKMHDDLLVAAEGLGEAARAALTSAAEAAGGIGFQMADYFETATKTAKKAFPWVLLTAVVAGGAYLYITTRGT